MTDEIFFALCAVTVLIMIIYHISRRRKVRSFLFGALTGCCALFILNEFGENFGIKMPLNIFNLCGSVFLGVPFLICEVLLKIL